MVFEPVAISELAAIKVAEIRSTKNIGAEYALRIGVNKAPGCGEKSFIIGFDKPGTNDIVYQKHNIQMVIRKSEVLFLDGVVVDYLDGEKSGFSIEKKS